MTKDPTVEKVVIWFFSTLFVLYGLPKIIIVYLDWLFSGLFKNLFSELLQILVHKVAQENHKTERN